MKVEVTKHSPGRVCYLKVESIVRKKGKRGNKHANVQWIITFM